MLTCTTHTTASYNVEQSTHDDDDDDDTIEIVESKGKAIDFGK
jgi:hypothetical protein